MSTDMTGWCALCRAGSHNTHNAALGGICVGCACPVTAADRPTVTDNARDEEPLAWCPGCGDRIPTEVIRERGVCSNCYGTTDDPWAAGRAETTTATTEDAARVINEVLGGDMDNHARIAAHRLADAGLLATARTHPTRDELAKVICESRWKVTAREWRYDRISSPQRKSWLETADAVLALLRGGA